MIDFKKHQSLILAIILPPLALLIVWAFMSLNFGQQLEYVTVDARFKARAQTDDPADERILLVGIGEQGLENFGRWPWKRSIHGDMMRLLTLRPPKSVAFDIIFSEESQSEEEDKAFADGLALHPGAMTGASAENLGHLPEENRKDAIPGDMIGNTAALTQVEGDISKLVGQDWALMPIPLLAESSMTGFVNVNPSDVDGKRRKAPLVIRAGSHVYPSLVLQTLMRNEHLTSDDVEVVIGKYIRVNGDKENWEIPIDDRGQVWINYRGTNSEDGNDIFEGENAVSYFGLMYFLSVYNQSLSENPEAEWPENYETPDGQKVPLPPVQDQFVLIGQTAAGLTDFGPTPMGSQTPLVKVHATVLNNILQGDYLKQVPLLPIVICWLALAWATVIPLRNSPVWVAISVPMILIAFFIGLGFFFFTTASLHIPLVWPVLGFILVHGTKISERLITESKAKGRIKAMFSTYVAPEVVNQLIASGEEPKLGGEETEITAFFSDIQSFSAFSEILPPERLVSLMNEYLTEMSHILKYSGSGTVDKFIGDAIVGIFGAPYHYPDHAHRGCVTAIEVQKRQAELREQWKKEGDWPEIVHAMRTRVGLNTGPAVVGNMGARDRMNYTMMGDTVNLAARSESGAKSYGVYTMITGDTKTSSEKSQDDIAFRYLDKIIVKGRTRPVEMYEVIDYKENLAGETQECLDLFGKGMAKYLNQDWDEAEKLFEKSEALESFRPGDPGVSNNPSLTMIKRCAVMKANPPGDDWDGVFVMTSK